MTGAVRTFTFIAEHIALDVLNTVIWRLDPGRRTDHLAAYADVLGWAAQAELVSGAERQILTRLGRVDPALAEAELAAFRNLRETAYAAVLERDAAAVERVVAEHRGALDRVRLARVGDHWHWTEPELALTTPRDRVVRAVIGLLTSPEVGVVHQCEDDACGWVYLDTSPRRNRRWCVAADCGNRNRARAFYARRKASAGSG